MRQLFKTVLDCIYPDSLYCVCCGKVIDWSRPYRLCDSCMNEIKWANGRTCMKCGKSLSDNDPFDICYSCRENGHVFDRAFTCAEYGTIIRSMIYSLKYDERPDIAASAGEIMADRLLSDFDPEELRSRYDLLVPVPVSAERLRMRGYNQAALIAGSFAEHTGMKYNGEIIRRVRPTPAMKGLSPAERRLIIRGSFEVRKEWENCIKGSSCLLIDDIFTTGSTADEIAAVLYTGGAEKVDFLSFAGGADVVKS